MADRYDPKLSVRPPGERKSTDPAGEADPLAELARMVSGRAPADGGGRGRAPGGDPAPEADIERDLEAELLNDLQASFAALSGPLDPAEAVAEAPAWEPPPLETVPEPPPEIEPEPEPTPEPPPVVAAAPARAAASRSVEPRPEPRLPEPFSFDISQAFDEAEAAAAKVVRAEQQRAQRPEREPRPYAPPMRGPAAAPRQEDAVRIEPPPPPRAALPVAARNDPPQAARGETLPQPRAERPATPERPPVRRPPPPARAERPSLPLRPLPMDDDMQDDDVPIPRVSASRAPRVEPTAPPPARFAPQRSVAVAAPPPAPPPILTRRRPEPEPRYAPPEEDEFELDLAELSDEDGPFEDEFTLDDLSLGDDGSDDDFPPFPEEEVAGLRRRRSGRVFAVVAGVLAIVAVGGAAVFLLRGDGGAGSPPPIIAADGGPTKVQPTATSAAETDSQSKLIYDRVDEAGSADGTRLVTGEPEIGSIPEDDGTTSDNAISRVIIPGGPGVDAPMSDAGQAGEAVVADAGVPPLPGDEAQTEIGPRMVRTVVVKPDGTIISSEATGFDENGNAVAGAPDDPDPAATDDALPELPRSEMDSVLDGGSLSVNTDPLSQPQPDPEPQPTATAEAAQPEPLPTPAEPDVPDLPSPQPEAPVAVAPAQAPAPQPPQQVASRNSGGPIDLTPGTAPAGGPAPAAGGVLVQVAAQRSEDAALSSYRSLQQRYPSILGAFQPSIVRADLGAKGVYYRVRVGPFNDGDAARLCNDLKSAGGDCMLAR